MDIEKFTDDEIRAEIERRKISATKPLSFSTLADMDLDRLRKLCESYIDSLAGGEQFKDPESTIFEQVISMFYGASVWDWINDRLG